jgi:hypothetical protein
MTLENKFVDNYFKLENVKFDSTSPKHFAEIRIDNPLGQRIQGQSDCKICKGEGYVKCRSGKHERACKLCLMKNRINKSVQITKENGTVESILINPLIGCEICQGEGLVKDKKTKVYIAICSCCVDFVNSPIDSKKRLPTF